MHGVIRIVLTMVGVGFGLNLLWENLQAPLYQGYTGFWQHFPFCLQATLGDSVMILFLYLLVSLVQFDMGWLKEIPRQNMLLVFLLGSMLGIIMEQSALQTGRWSYATMPVLPFLNVGFWPILQMSLLPLTTFCVTSSFIKKVMVDTRAISSNETHNSADQV